MPESSSTVATFVDVPLTLKIDLALLRYQKTRLVELRHGCYVSAPQEEAVEGILNLLDFIQDSIADQGLADERQVFALRSGR